VKSNRGQIPSNGFEKIAAYTKDIEVNDRVGQSTIRIYPFSDFIERVSQIIRKKPEITKCDDVQCLRCRDMSGGGRRHRAIE
jgi:hypothetical protein